MSRLIDADELPVYERINAEYLKYDKVVYKRDIGNAPTVVCHCNVKENEKLICKIMDCDADGKVFIYNSDTHGCGNCKYTNISEYDEPCRLCMYSYKSMFKPKPHWVTLTDCANEGIYCSECNTKIFDFTHEPKKKMSNYCPNCGAKMEENQHG